MKKIILLATAVIFMLGLLVKPVFAADLVKIGYLDVGAVFDKYRKTKEADATLDTQAKSKQAERDRLVTEITRLRDELELLSEKGKKDKQAIIDEKVKKLQEFDKATRTDLQKQRDAIIGDILKEIDKTVQDYGTKQGYDFILNDKVLVYKKDALNITEDIIKTLNDRYNLQPGAASAGKG